MPERFRNREMTSYFAAVGITVDDTGRLRAPSLSSSPAEPALCDDAVLNSLTQTGALRLQCDRAFVSLIGQQWQYIVAEASAHLPYRRQNLKPTDRMCLGFTSIASEMAICLNTLKCFTDTTGCSALDDGNTQADGSRYRIRDLQADAMFRSRPYVTGWPNIRAYLEVPLKTSTGLVIGSYCVVDSNLRDDFDDRAMPVMTEVAQNVMDHLDLLKMKQQCERAERLVRGLGVFVAGCSSLRDWPRDGTDPAPPYTVPPHDGLLSVDNSQSSSHAPSPGSSDTRHSSAETERFSSATSLATPLSSITDVDPLDLQLQCPLDDDAPCRRLPPSEPSPPPAAHDTNLAFSRAANLIREATSIEGIVFLDACPTGFGSLHAKESGDGVVCEILGSSTGSRTAPINEGFKVPESLLQRLLHSNPQGRLIYADENGPISPSANATDDDDDDDDSRRNASERQRASKKDVVQLLGIVPQARSLLFLPLWDYHKETWYAAAIGWTTDPTRSFEETDMTYISAFSNSIMAEVARLDALVTSAAKGDFISSISHEFRSPLHGIMASTELLEDSASSQDPDQRQLTGMIRSCATTLIDTTNHLLDFAKINRLVKDDRPNRPSLLLDQQQVPAPGGGITTLSSTVDLARLVEEVVEGAFIGNASQAALKPHYHDGQQPNAAAAAEPAVVVTMDIERRDGWSLRTEPGAWRRIVMNILGNALKYTARGSIAVSLKTIETRLSSPSFPTSSPSPPPPHTRTDISFSVADTGCGMSPDYVKRQLFTPYSQANALSSGVGLGLSIVRHLVRELGGAIDVESAPGVGTRMTVTIPTGARVGPLFQPAPEEAADNDGDTERQAAESLRGRTVAAIDLDDATAESSSSSPRQTSPPPLPLLPAFAAMAETWVGVDVVAPPAPTRETTRGLWSGGGHPADGPPLIVLCKAAPTAGQKHSAAFRNATFLVQPFGPRKLAWTIGRAFARRAERGKVAVGTAGMRAGAEQGMGGAAVGSTVGIAEIREGMEERMERGSGGGAGGAGGTAATAATAGIATGATETRGTGRTIETRWSERAVGAAEAAGGTGGTGGHATPDIDLVYSIKNLSVGAAPTKEPSQVKPAMPAKHNHPHVNPPSSPSHSIPLPPPPLTRMPTAPKRPHVLAVDDNGVNLKILTTSMKKMQCTFETATNGLEAVQTFRGASRPFDYIFMDISMPIMDGFEATREIRAHEQQRRRGSNSSSSSSSNNSSNKFPRALIVALTGLGAGSSQKEAFASGVDIYLMKPVPLKKLKELVLGSGDV